MQRLCRRFSCRSRSPPDVRTRGTERAPVRRRGDSRLCRQVPPQRGGGGEADLVGDPFGRQVAGLQLVPRPPQPLLGQSAAGTQTGLLLEAPGEGTGAHRRVRGQLVQ